MVSPEWAGWRSGFILCIAELQSKKSETRSCLFFFGFSPHLFAFGILLQVLFTVSKTRKDHNVSHICLTMPNELVQKYGFVQASICTSLDFILQADYAKNKYGYGSIPIDPFLVG